MLQKAEENGRTGSMAAPPTDTTAAAPQVDADAWVGVLRKELQKQPKAYYAAATKAWEVFKTVEALNTKLVRMVMEQLNVTSKEASDLLMSSIAVPARKGSSREIVAYRYLKRTIYHLYDILSKAAVKAYIFHVNAATQMGAVVPKSLEFSAADSSYLQEVDRFVYEIYGHKGHVEGGLTVATLIGYGENVTENGGPGGGTKVLVCMLSQHAFVVTKVREYLKRLAGIVAEGAGSAAVMNEGHREAWVREMSSMDNILSRVNVFKGEGGSQ